MMPNSEEMAYAAFATVNELIDVLVDRQILDAGRVEKMLVSVSETLQNSSNNVARRAARLIRDVGKD